MGRARDVRGSLQMLQLNESLIAIPGSKPSQFEASRSPAEMAKSFLDFLRRQFPIILFSVLLCGSLGVAYVFTAPPMFTAQTSMIIDTHKVQLFRKLEQASNNNIVDSSTVDSEVELLKSENVINAVIKRFNLANDPEFVGPAEDIFHRFHHAVLNLLGPNDIPKTDYERTRRAVEVFSRRMTVKRVGLSYIIQVSFTSLDPKRAAAIADAVANEYIVDQLQAKFQAARQAGGWLRDRLRELREQASAAERAVVEFKVQNNIVSTSGGAGGAEKRLMTDQQVGELNSQLAIARAQVSEASARFERIQAVLRNGSPDATVDATVTDSLKNDVINKLRSQYLSLAEREADWAKRYGNNHLAVVNLRSQMSEIRHSILDELRRIAESYKSDYEIAKQRQAGIEQELGHAVTRSQSASRAQVQLTELESNAQSYRTLYDDFLQRYTESVQAQSFPVTDARIVTPAAPPLTKSDPKTILVISVSVLGGLILGLAIGHLRDLTDRVFRTREQVERLLALDCLSTVPRIKARRLKNRSGGQSTHGAITIASLPPAPSLKLQDEPDKSFDGNANVKVVETNDTSPPAVPKIGANEGSLPPVPTIQANEGSLPPVPTIEANEGSLPPVPTIQANESSSDNPASAPNIEKVKEPNPVDDLSGDANEGRASSDSRTIARRDQLLWEVVDFPLSPYAEAIRSIKMAVDLTRVRTSKKVRKPKKIIGITSSSPNEGKSTISASLAQLISHSGKQVLLVDCDLRAPRLTRVLAPNAKAGLIEVMSGEASLRDVVWTDESKKLSFLPAVTLNRTPHTAEIIGGEEIRALFDRLRNAYDYIIVDLTPLVPIIDVRGTEGLVDYYVFVIEWGRTKVDLVERSLKEASGIYTKILGVVLNKVADNQLRRYEGYGSYNHEKYYRR
jgi:capsular exopolysaccharide synthesis family protein